jgi:peptide/nickel transport system substrate-binding protein
MVSGDWAAPPPDIAAQYLKSKASQFHVGPSQSLRYIAMDSAKPPFNNINLRKAVIAVTNRNALILTRGGPYIGIAGTHMIPPGLAGYDQAGGATGPGNDYYANPNGNVTLAESYMKKAGYASGKYTGPPLLMVGDNSSPAKQTAEAFATQISQIGIKVNLQEVPHATMYTKFCEVPKTQPPLCPNVAWGKDFFDSQSIIVPLTYGPNIAPSGNVNTADINDPAINAAIVKAEQVTDATARANAWAAIDKMVTAGAYYDVWIWDNEVGLRSTNVNGAWNQFNSDWDLANSSLQ